VDYEVDLQTKLKGAELERLWAGILQSLATKFNSILVQDRKVRQDELVDGWCKDLAKSLGLAYYRNDDWLNFCDSELAPN
jgi:hypothetical protein